VGMISGVSVRGYGSAMHTYMVEWRGAWRYE
jgi:hypothetical protein